LALKSLNSNIAFTCICGEKLSGAWLYFGIPWLLTSSKSFLTLQIQGIAPPTLFLPAVRGVIRLKIERIERRIQWEWKWTPYGQRCTSGEGF